MVGRMGFFPFFFGKKKAVCQDARRALFRAGGLGPRSPCPFGGKREKGHCLTDERAFSFRLFEFGSQH